MRRGNIAWVTRLPDTDQPAPVIEAMSERGGLDVSRLAFLGAEVARVRVVVR